MCFHTNHLITRNCVSVVWHQHGATPMTCMKVSVLISRLEYSGSDWLMEDMRLYPVTDLTGLRGGKKTVTSSPL